MLTGKTTTVLGAGRVLLQVLRVRQYAKSGSEGEEGVLFCKSSVSPGSSGSRLWIRFAMVGRKMTKVSSPGIVVQVLLGRVDMQRSSRKVTTVSNAGRVSQALDELLRVDVQW